MRRFLVALVFFVGYPHNCYSDQIDLEEIGGVCGGLANIAVEGQRVDSTYKDYDIVLEGNGDLKVYRNGVLLSRIDDFTYAEYSQCIKDLISALQSAGATGDEALRVVRERLTRADHERSNLLSSLREMENEYDEKVKLLQTCRNGRGAGGLQQAIDRQCVDRTQIVVNQLQREIDRTKEALNTLNRQIDRLERQIGSID
jgi:hypothetical protein